MEQRIPNFFQLLGSKKVGMVGLGVTNNGIAKMLADDGAGAEVEEHLQVAGDDTALLPGGHQFRQVKGDAGGPEDDILLQPAEVVVAQHQAD